MNRGHSIATLQAICVHHRGLPHRHRQHDQLRHRQKDVTLDRTKVNTHGEMTVPYAVAVRKTLCEGRCTPHVHRPYCCQTDKNGDSQCGCCLPVLAHVQCEGHHHDQRNRQQGVALRLCLCDILNRHGRNHAKRNLAAHRYIQRSNHRGRRCDAPT